MIRHIRDDILEIYLLDNVKARLMQPDGNYLRLTPMDGQVPINVQEYLLEQRIV
jgi:polyphosphate kinase